MFNLIIVDDEALVLRELKDFIDWEKYGFKIVGCFSNANDALNFMSINSVDAVITDINLPMMNGIEFAKKCMEMYPGVSIGFISAYRNFEYAYAAVNLNVAGYILKPFVEDEITDMLKALKRHIQNNSLYLKYVNDTGKYKFEKMQYLVEGQQVLSDIMYEDLKDKNVIEKKLLQIGININIDCAYYSIIMVNVVNFSEYLKKIWKKDFLTLCNAVNSVVCLKYDDFYVIPLYFADNSFFFVSAADKNRQNIDFKMNVMTAVIRNNLAESLKMETETDIINTFDSLLDIVQLQHSQQLRDYAVEENVIDTALKYIEENYNKIVSINDVAKYVHLSPIYFGRYFANKTGKSFRQYLNELRIESAKTLLKDKNLKISTIAEMIGYNNLSYFYKVFGESEGMTPVQYREEQR